MNTSSIEIEVSTKSGQLQRPNGPPPTSRSFLGNGRSGGSRSVPSGRPQKERSPTGREGAGDAAGAIRVIRVICVQVLPLPYPTGHGCRTPRPDRSGPARDDTAVRKSDAPLIGAGARRRRPQALGALQIVARLGVVGTQRQHPPEPVGRFGQTAHLGERHTPVE